MGVACGLATIHHSRILLMGHVRNAKKRHCGQLVQAGTTQFEGTRLFGMWTLLVRAATAARNSCFRKRNNASGTKSTSCPFSPELFDALHADVASETVCNQPKKQHPAVRLIPNRDMRRSSQGWSLLIVRWHRAECIAALASASVSPTGFAASPTHPVAAPTFMHGSKARLQPPY